MKTNMRITAREVLEKQAAPMPGGGRPMGGQPGRPAPMGMEPAAPEDPAGTPGADPNAPPDPNGAAQADGGSEDLQQLTQSLLNDYFDDQKINDASTRIQKLIPIIGPEHAEKYVKVYSDWIKASMTMKANLLAMVVMATPQQMMQNQMNQMMKQLQMGGQGGAPGQQPLKVPVT